MRFFQRQAAECAGALDVMAERVWCLPGETITGVVLLRLARPLQHTVLTIALVGQEDLQAVHTDSDGDAFHVNSVHVLVDHPIELRQGPLAAGDLAVPFSIPVPHGLPPPNDMQYVTDLPGRRCVSDLRARIAYALQCQLIIRDAKSLKQVIPFRVTAYPATRAVGEPREATASRTFHYGLLLKQGSCALRAAIATNVVGVGARVSTRVWLTLAPRERLRSVTLSLCRTIVTHTKSLQRHHGASVALCMTRFDRALLGDNTSEFDLHMPIDGTSAPQVGGKRKLVPLYPTETFHHFSVTHELVVACDVRGCRQVEVRIPVMLVGARIERVGAVAAIA